MRIRLSARYQWEDTNSPPFFDKTFTGPRITIGNSPTASLPLNGSVLSGEQIVIICEEAEPQVINQAEGTSLNGEILALNASRTIKHGDLLTVGTYKIDIAFDGGPSPSSDDTAVESDTFLPDTNHRSMQSRSFAAILDSLRTDEDRFYFVIEGGTQSGVRIPIELEEMPLGWDGTGEHLCFDISSIEDLCAIVHKDWSGVVLRTQPDSVITINGEPLADERRLHDGDRLFLSPPEKGVPSSTQVVLTFREPTSLVILDSVMPRVREDSAASAESGPVSGGERIHVQKPVQKLAALIKSDREYFTVFTFVELSLMAIGTMVGAIIIFLVLNYS